MSQRTPNQVVAANLARARALRGWTQEEAADRLEPYLGVRWSKATFSSAERSATGDRVRQFTADDLYAFARAFELPVVWFLLPDEESNAVGQSLDLLFKVHPDLVQRVSALLAELAALPSHDVRPLAEELSVDAVRLTAQTIVRAALATKLGDLESAGSVIEEIAGSLIDVSQLQDELTNVTLTALNEVLHGSR